MDTNNIRNVALISHGGAGKTSLIEAMLFNSGSTKRLGDVDSGNSIMDFDPVEISRKLSINTKFASIESGKYLLNLIDTPGYSNFLHETRTALCAAGGAVVLASAITGVKAETERAWHYADEYSLARIIFVNKMDKERADFYRALSTIEKVFNIKAVPLCLPIGAEDNFKGFVDLVSMKSYYFNEKSNGLDTAEIPEDMLAEAERYRTELVEAASETDDLLLIEKYLEDGGLTEEDLKKGIKEGTVTKKFIPVLCGSAVKNQGTEFLTDAITSYLPSPLEEPLRMADDLKNNEQIFVKPTDNFFSAVVFKTLADPFAGKLTLFRVISGSVKNDTEVLNSSRDEKEKITQLFLMQGKNTIKAEELSAGQIGMVNKLRYTQTFDTICSVGSKVIFPYLQTQPQVISFSIVPKSKDDEDKVSNGLNRLLEEDPGLKMTREAESSELLLSGMGQMHIETVVEKLQKKFNVQVEMKSPKVPYRETIKEKSSGQGKYKKQSGGRGQYGDVWIEVSPLKRGEGFYFEDKIVGGVVPKNYIPAVEKGIREAMTEGVISGYPMVDFKVSLYDGSYHSVDSSEMAFKIAASMAYKKAASQAVPVLLEPVMNMDIFVPEDLVGAVIGDLNARRGKIVNVEPQKSGQHIRAQVPMSEVLTYAPELRGLTGGHGVFTMEFSYYEELPPHLTEQIINKNEQ